MDLVGEAISAMRTGDPQAARALLKPPWGLRFNAAGGAGVQVILRGEAWLIPPDGGEPIHMAAGDVALIRRQRPHGMADDPSTPLYDVTIDEHDPAAHWPADGSAMDEGVPGTVLLGGSYYLNGARPHPLFESLPDVIHLPARIGAPGPVRTVVELLGAEMDSERPGTSVAVPALLDLLLLYTMRTWLETTTQPLGWAQALRDPALSAALRAIQERPAEPWTVASLAREASLSRAAFARRFATLTGQPPLGYLTWWRMTIAARLLQTSDMPMEAIAGRVGYSSEYAFSKAFKRELGLAPAHYRRQQRHADRGMPEGASPVSSGSRAGLCTEVRSRSLVEPVIQSIVSGVPIGSSLANWTTSELGTRIQPWDGCPGMSHGSLVPWMPMTPPPGQSVSTFDSAEVPNATGP